MTSNAQKFSWLVIELRSLLESYMVHSEDSQDDPVTYYAMLNLLMSLQVLERYAQNDPQVVTLLKSLSDKHLEILRNMHKH